MIIDDHRVGCSFDTRRGMDGRHAKVRLSAWSEEDFRDGTEPWSAPKGRCHLSRVTRDA